MLFRSVLMLVVDCRGRCIRGGGWYGVGVGAGVVVVGGSEIGRASCRERV